jgi:hypothetical protein
VCADEKVGAFMKLESATRAGGRTSVSGIPVLNFIGSSDSQPQHQNAINGSVNIMQTGTSLTRSGNCGLRIVDYLFFLRKNRLNARRFKNFPAAFTRSAPQRTQDSVRL